MTPESIRKLLDQVQSGALDTDSAFNQLKTLPYEDLGFATIDHHRAIRQGTPEVIFCQNKTTEEIATIMTHLRDKGSPILATRATAESFKELKSAFPDAIFNERSRTITLGETSEESVGSVLVVSAGTSDYHVAEEATVTARFMGSNVKQISDVGVAGIHRLLGRVEEIRSANAIVVVAGMEGALASVVGGLVEVPVIGVPTSVGYGASFGGLSALLAMLNSCSAGVTVVNIDNGFGGGFAASVINKRICDAQSETQ